MKLRVSDEARQQILKEKHYLASQSRWASVDFTAKIERALKLIAAHPEIGTMAGTAPAVRRFVHAPYHIYYVLRQSGIVILSVWHGRQIRQELESDEDFGN
ncbi:type II toxin-antitoxin system RelE/ParE family toxin [Rhizobium sp. SL86]|jgi:plasmid stabilization system protein ParE|uniref:type II toxin-antitoxin system RelE/ParE family toxin n=1 Tax=Rhizobium sp. SL86 TaxID=2995148 RepID=UPI002273E3BD|nr:type II toxin-antitoxin system RelE/ParE family toxin [Rhizobium sp. SL86]MCY1664175.1 type II toxin-antitoxin system RelE/ParE family toxin [Rhizobium sp. SL86]